MKSWKEVINLSELGKLFQSDVVLNSKACLQISLKILGTIKKKKVEWFLKALKSEVKTNYDGVISI